MQGFMYYAWYFANNLIEIMGIVLAGALIYRLLASRSSMRDQVYFKSFARAVEKTLDVDESLRTVDEHDIDGWVKTLTDKVLAQMPDRGLRFGSARERMGMGEGGFRFRDKEGFSEFAEGKKSIVHGIRAHVDVLKSNHPPNFAELADRILDQDRQWKTVAGVSVEILQRFMEILPGLFVIGGILGTFIGIASGLPMIGKIDLEHIGESGPVLSAFIDNIALSMRTSISGIMYSVAMTILNTIFPIHAQRADVEKSVTRCLEIIWNRIHGHKLSYADARVIELLEKIAAAGGNGHGQGQGQGQGAKSENGRGKRSQAA